MPEARGDWLLALLPAGLGAGAFALYRLASPAVAEWAALPYATALLLAPAWAYPLLRRRGAAAGRAVAGALALPLLWLAKEGWRMSAVFGLGETLFYALNPVCLGLFAWSGLQIAAGELALRRARGGRWELASAPGLYLVGVLAAAALGGLLFRGDDANLLFYAYIALYRHLFGGAG